ncbi:MAG: HAMP domain-containing histidine kinase [Clostridia bacterium]|nr:HAMP domain-containing histidine kinase [Clostridia bacterium]
MNKLKNKVFWVIFLILTVFLISILFIFNHQTYRQEKSQIESNLTRLEDNRIKDEHSKLGRPDKIEGNEANSQISEKNEINMQAPQRIFMDAQVYTILLDSNNQVKEIVSHTEDGMSDSEITTLANEIIGQQKENYTKIGNLYFDNYSYSYQKYRFLTIIDNTVAKERVVSLLKSSLLIFVCLELVIIYVSIKLTSWIIKPVLETFEKQKQFIADASHELKTPIAVIMASSEALEKDYETKWIHNIQSETERMSRLVSNLLDLAKLENGANQEQYALNNLSKTIEISILTLEGLMYEKNITLNYQIEENIQFRCDNDQMKQLMAILLDNAIKHSSKDGEIVVLLKKEKSDIMLVVKNKGEGIPKGSEEKIFERFYRADESRNRDENRYGLGLAIAKSIVTNHGGKISAHSENGYTTFQVIFK